MNVLVGIIGGHASNTRPEALAIAEQVGFEIGRRGMSVVCGGYDGIMEAACRGCKAAGGTTVAILKGTSAAGANCHVDFAIPTAMDVASNNIIVWASHGLVAFDGRYGTLNEIALALDFGKPLIVVGRPSFLDVGAIAAPTFRYEPSYDPGRASSIVETLQELIKGSAVTPAR